MNRMIQAIVLVCLLCAAASLGAETASGDSLFAVTLTPDTIEVGMFYSGTEVSVSAEIPDCGAAVLVLEAGSEEIRLNRKGRVAGIWLNVAQVTARNVPKVYILASSGRLEDICSPEMQRELRLGPDYLRREIEFSCEKPLTGSEFDEFLKLKTGNGTYDMDVGIDLKPAESGMMKLSADLMIAPTIPPGTYNVMVYCFSGGNPVYRGSSELTVERIGLARLMVKLAHDHPAIYGILAVAVAMLVGIVMGVVFDSLPGSGH
jgi:uncharacterized protein (TIGR02186 family)